MSKGNFKVKCIQADGPNCNLYTVGKVYEVKNGKLTTDNGLQLPNHYCVDGFYDWSSFSGASWELVSESQSIHIYRHDNEVIATLKTGKQTTKTAKAKCNPSDEFKFEIGAKLAFQRLIGEDENTVREVHRPAKVGEWVKLINDDPGSSKYYLSGEVCKVVQIRAFGVFATTKKTHPCNCGAGTSFLYNTEYVVLENYQPEDKPKTLADYTIKELVTELSRRYE